MLATLTLYKTAIEALLASRQNEAFTRGEIFEIAGCPKRKTANDALTILIGAGKISVMENDDGVRYLYARK